jgi:hypothetical protein
MKLLFLFLISFNVFGQAGMFQPFNPYSIAPDAITTKGGLLTSNGTNQVVKEACADDEIIIFDASISFGFKCGTIPPDTNAASLCSAGEYLDGDGTCKTASTGGGGGTTECQTKKLASDITNKTSETVVSFENLTVGKKYQITGQASLRSDDAGSTTVFARHDSIDYGAATINPSAGGIAAHTYAFNSKPIVATTTTYEVIGDAPNTSRYILGNDTFLQTYFTLCELPDSTIVDSTKFNAAAPTGLPYTRDFSNPDTQQSYDTFTTLTGVDQSDIIAAELYLGVGSDFGTPGEAEYINDLSVSTSYTVLPNTNYQIQIQTSTFMNTMNPSLIVTLGGTSVFEDITSVNGLDLITVNITTSPTVTDNNLKITIQFNSVDEFEYQELKVNTITVDDI